MEYFSFVFCQYADGNIINSGEVFYYTTGGLNHDDMKGFVRTQIVKDPAAVITLQNIQPISKEFYEMKMNQIANKVSA